MAPQCHLLREVDVALRSARGLNYCHGMENLGTAADRCRPDGRLPETRVVRGQESTLEESAHPHTPYAELFDPTIEATDGIGFEQFAGDAADGGVGREQE